MSPATRSERPSSDQHRQARMQDALGASDMMEPVLAGQRARACADLCELLDLAAVLLDDTGTVLHASSRAGRVLGLGTDIRIVGRQLAGETQAVNDALSEAVGSVVQADRNGLVTTQRIDCGSWIASVATVPFPDESGFQRLKGVLVFSEPANCADGRLLRLLVTLSGVG